MFFFAFVPDVGVDLWGIFAEGVVGIDDSVFGGVPADFPG